MTPTKEITSADVMAWLLAQAAALDFPGAQVQAYAHGREDGWAFRGWIVTCSELPSPSYQAGDTFEEAVAKVRANLKSPKDKAEALRAEAARLMEQAAALEAKL